jgi:hypothetical protein
VLCLEDASRERHTAAMLQRERVVFPIDDDLYRSWRAHFPAPLQVSTLLKRLPTVSFRNSAGCYAYKLQHIRTASLRDAFRRGHTRRTSG